MMKKIFLFLGLLALPCIGTAAEKKIQMVTYFPTPYVAYSNVQATTALDIGLTGTCEMELGCDKSGLALRASSTVVVQKGTFDLNAAGRVQSETVTLGKGGGAGTFDFDADLVVTRLENGQSVEAINMQVDNLYLFPSHTTQDGRRFPKCNDITMSWQKLSDNQTYLVCGDAPEVQECTKHAFNTDTGAEDAGFCCESDGSVTFTNSSGILEEWTKEYADANGYCCNTYYCCLGAGSPAEASVCTPDLGSVDKNKEALKFYHNADNWMWKCGALNPAGSPTFWYSCTDNNGGSTEPVCHWNSGEKKELVDKEVNAWDGALFDAAGGDDGPGVSGPVWVNNITGFEDTCDRACSKLTDTCQEGYQISRCRQMARADDGVVYYLCTFTHTEKKCECN